MDVMYVFSTIKEDRVETERFGRVSVLFFVDFIRLGNSIQYSGRNRCPNFLFFTAEASLVPSDIVKLTKTCCVH